MNLVNYATKRFLLAMAILIAILYIVIEILPANLEMFVVYFCFGWMSGSFARWLTDKVIQKPEELNDE